jgi:hypothetical protein
LRGAAYERTIPHPMKKAVVLVVALAASLAGFSVTFGLCGAAVPSLLAGALVAALAGWAAHARLTLDESAAPRALRVLGAIAAVLALVQVGRLTVFMADASRTGFSAFPGSTWEVKHSCLTAYYVAGRAVGEGRNVYDDSLYNAPGDDPARPRMPRALGPFNVDPYEYPPPFLLLPRALDLFAPDFSRLRALTFGLHVALMLGAMLVVTRLLGPAAGTRALLLLPLVWAAPPMLSLLQKSNVQGVIVALSMVAMALFARHRSAAGGLLLAFAIASKLYPGLLVPYLLLRRQWRALAWTAGWGFGLVAASLLDTGLAPYGAFLEQLPTLLSGEAFAAFRNPGATATNVSVPGIALKLKLLGVPGMGFGAMKVVGWAWTLVALGALALYVRRRTREEEQPLVWLAILVLATLRSPFLPQGYGAVPPLWLLTLLAAAAPPAPRVLALTAAAWLTFAAYVPIDRPMAVTLRMALFTVPQLVMIALPLLLLRREPATAQPA